MLFAIHLSLASPQNLRNVKFHKKLANMVLISLENIYTDSIVEDR